ncbi:MAG: hypothetical protein A6F71_10240 [Cycloclasticus sp. symbiont of Poecilosclerida sp. M]|nr:MAG: hypothetical protein A6F71_10240 [Cycloclasticus sp. symbiont of Poecilosclerida sp. M]
MLHQPFRHLDELRRHTLKLTRYSCTVHPSLADDIHRLEVTERENRDTENAEEVNVMIMSLNAEFPQTTGEEEECDWSLASKAYPDLLEMPSFIAQQRQDSVCCAIIHLKCRPESSSGKTSCRLTQSCMSTQSQSVASQDDCVWHCRNRKVVSLPLETPVTGDCCH